MNPKELLVAAIENGTVIDHIPADKIFHVVNLLKLENVTSAVTIGYNLKSRLMGQKSIIKIANKYFSDEELNQLAVICPDITLCIIKDFEVVEKKRISLPDEMIGIVKCDNPNCITNHEPMKTRFHVSGATLTCHYCNHSMALDKVKLL